MLAARVHGYGGAESIVVEQIADPSRADGAVLVDVLAVGLNAYDLLILADRYQVSVPLPYTPGTEFVGLIREAPPGCGLVPGDRVVGKVQSGALAERVVCARESLRRAEDWMSVDEAASYRVAYETAIHALRTVSSVWAGDWILVVGASGGIGLALLDVARALGIAAIAACRPADFESCCRAGARACLDSTADDLVAEVKNLTDGGPVAVFDPVGGNFSQQAVRAVRPGGTVVVLGFASGEISSVRLNRILLKGISITGFQNRTVAETHPQQARESLRYLDRLLQQRRISPVVAATFALSEAREAFSALSARSRPGKVVVRVPRRSGLG
jgi:NADPH:quinone reductase-like Zn-dependent oxidoreductase